MPTAHPDGDTDADCWRCHGSGGWWTTGDDMPYCDADDEGMCGMCDWVRCDECSPRPRHLGTEFDTDDPAEAPAVDELDG